MSFSIPSLLCCLLLLLVLSGFFSAAEIGLMSINRYRLRHLVREKHKKALRVQEMLVRPDRLLSVILIGNTVANVLASMIATVIGQRLHGDLGMLLATVGLTLMILVFSEMTPKTLAALHPERVAFFVAPPLRLIQVLLLPLVALSTRLTNTLLRCFGIVVSRTVQQENLSGEELRAVVHEAGILIPSEHKRMLISLLELEQATVEDVMIPKSELSGLDLSRPWADLLALLETTQYTRLPVYQADLNHLVGVIHVRHILHRVLDGSLTAETLEKMADAPYFVPEGTALDLQLLNFQKMKRRSCFVVNEYGDLQGLVTLEDILEEVVGEFTTDLTDLTEDILRQPDGSVIIDATMPLRQLNRALQADFPLIGPKTLSGLIVETLGYIPPANCCLKIKTVYIEILKVSANTVRSVRLLNHKETPR